MAICLRVFASSLGWVGFIIVMIVVELEFVVGTVGLFV